ncbi:hypothetical protein C7974DRAFT_3884 [Boeremia exigua]|uniref:uncharacterized protein n=1 Tax=Boeremia exigua TaxID=749465 RepID=UPI001E8E9676|nr:uncharacterized protein C7974DRAFT_3884 [Boeremia exigua]KAH6643708.1 hypothetical protein C7974DRAFT_3884 [Boeremia exigua]
MLPRMKFRNPSIPMTVSRHIDPQGPSTASAPPSATQTTLVPDASRPTHSIDIRMMQHSKIREELLKAVCRGAVSRMLFPQQIIETDDKI